jgi:CO dehydrogenase maturation factor
VRIAVAGKGGAGKTTISALLARLAARAGRATLAIDADANPNLASALGVQPGHAEMLRPVTPDMVSRRLGGAGLTEPLETVLERYSLSGPDGVRLMLMGSPQHADEGCMCAAHAVVSALLEDLDAEPGNLVVVDMEASPEHLSRGTIRHVDAVWLVAEPYYRSLETVRRMGALVAELGVPTVAVVANKVRSDVDASAVAEFCDRHGFRLAGAVPWDDAVVAADRARSPVVDWPSAAPVTDAVARLMHQLSVDQPAGACTPP